MARNEFVCDCNVIHQDLVESTQKQMVDEDILNKMADFKYITEEDLYKYSEEEIVNKIRICPNEKIANAFDFFENAREIGRSETKVEGK